MSTVISWYELADWVAKRGAHGVTSRMQPPPDVVSRVLRGEEVDSPYDRPVPRVSPLSDSDEELDEADYVVPSSDSTKPSALDMDDSDEDLTVDLNPSRRSERIPQPLRHRHNGIDFSLS